MVVTETRGEGASLGGGRVLWKCSGGSAILVCTDSEDGFADNGAYVDGIAPSCGFDRAISSYTLLLDENLSPRVPSGRDHVPVEASAHAGARAPQSPRWRDRVPPCDAPHPHDARWQSSRAEHPLSRPENATPAACDPMPSSDRSRPPRDGPHPHDVRTHPLLVGNASPPREPAIPRTRDRIPTMEALRSLAASASPLARGIPSSRRGAASSRPKDATPPCR
jgi:hypothetical protein